MKYFFQNKTNKGKLKRQERKKEAALLAAKQIIIDQADSQVYSYIYNLLFTN